MPERCECLRDSKPIATGALRPVVLAHAGTLAFMSLRIPAGGGADFLRAIGLDDVELAVAGEKASDEVIEPGLRQLPTFELGIPLGLGAFVLPQPGIIIGVIWQFQFQSVAFAFP